MFWSVGVYDEKLADKIPQASVHELGRFSVYIIRQNLR